MKTPKIEDICIKKGKPTLRNNFTGNCIICRKDGNGVNIECKYKSKKYVDYDHVALARCEYEDRQ